MPTLVNDLRRPSWLSELPPGLKLGWTVLFVCGIALLPRQPDRLYLFPVALLLALWPLSCMPIGYAARRLAIAQLFILGIALLWLFSPKATPLVLSVVLKSNLSVLAMVLLAWTTPFHEILQCLRRVRLPPVMLTTLALMFRYLPVLGEESTRMRRARASRTFTRSRRFAWRNLSQIVAQLFLRSIDRAERIYLAMIARGWK